MLTPMDIDHVEFKKVMRGYDPEEVEDFLIEINESYGKLYMEHQEAKEQIARLSDAVAEYKSMEETLQNALSVAKRDGEDMKRAAQAEAEALLQEAKACGEEEIARLSYQYEQMKRNVEIFRAKTVSLLRAQLDIIKEYDEEAKPAAEVQAMPTPEVKAAVMEEQHTVEIPPISSDITKE